MKPIRTKETNVTFAKDQPQYMPLPVHHRHNETGEVISCWKLSLRERLKILFTGRLWLSMLTFNNSLQPQLPSVDKELFIFDGGIND